MKAVSLDKIADRILAAIKRFASTPSKSPMIKTQSHKPQNQDTRVSVLIKWFLASTGDWP